MREYTVFNVAQCDGLPERIVNGAPMRVRNPDTRDELADAYIASTGAKIVEGSGEAYYMPSQDLIVDAGIRGVQECRQLLCHHVPRADALDRAQDPAANVSKPWRHASATKAYAAEELVAELGSAFQCAEFAFDSDVRDAGYIQHWIKLLKEDKKAFFTAASAAQKAVDFLRGKALEEDVAEAA